MELARYDVIRETLIDLYNTINNRLYPIWIKPSSMMSLDELRERPHQTSLDCIPDENFYERAQRREYRLPDIVKMLPNMMDPAQEIAFDQSNTYIPMIYEAIQEYLYLWVELINELPDLVYPNINELRSIEDIARLIFPTYAQIKPYLDYKKDLEESVIRKELAQSGLLGLVGIMTKNKMGSVSNADELSFISHLDNIGKFGVYHRMAEQMSKPSNGVSLSTDSLLEGIGGAPGHSLGEWTYIGGNGG